MENGKKEMIFPQFTAKWGPFPLKAILDNSDVAKFENIEEQIRENRRTLEFFDTSECLQRDGASHPQNRIFPPSFVPLAVS